MMRIVPCGGGVWKIERGAEFDGAWGAHNPAGQPSYFARYPFISVSSTVSV